MKKKLLFAAALVLGAVVANAQCIDWVQPSPTSGWIDLDSAPCNGDFFEEESIEVFASEAYSLEGVLSGGVYIFSNCNGPGAGAWINDYTIIAPSGAVDAFGAGDGCSITWTASEGGVYLIVINEEGACGVEGDVGNGFPKITTISGGENCAAPPVFIDGAESFEDGVLPECWTSTDEDGDGFIWNVYEGLAFDGDYSIRSESWEPGGAVLNPDNYLITPELELGVNDSLYYVVGAANPEFAFENYSVLISTTGSEIADFNDVLLTEELETADFQGRSINLSAYDNQTIHIAFRHHNVSDELFLVIDAVALPGVVNCGPDAVSEIGALASVEVFPNPSKGVFNVVNNGSIDSYQIRVFDMSGKHIASEQIVLSNGAQYQLNLNDFATGVYMLQFVSSTEAGTIRIVKN